MSKKYTVRAATEADFPAIAAFFTRNKAYQTTNFVAYTTEDIALLVRIKEIKDFYLLFDENEILLGTVGTYYYSTEISDPTDGVCSGFLLIDPTVRDGRAIQYLYSNMYETLPAKLAKTFYSEISIENKASLQLARLNGYVLYDGTREDAGHHVLFRNDLPKIKTSVSITNEVFDYPVMEGKFREASWENGSYKAKFDAAGHVMEAAITERHPWWVKFDELELTVKTDFQKAQMILDFKRMPNFKVDELMVRFDEKEEVVIAPTLSEKITLEGFHEKLEVLLRKDYSWASVKMSPRRFVKPEKMQEFQFAGTIFQRVTVNLTTGDVQLNDLLVDVFPRFHISHLPEITAERRDDCLTIRARYESKGLIEKRIIFDENSIKVQLHCQISGRQLRKYGLKMLHSDYYVDSERGFERYRWLTVDKLFVRSETFDQQPKRYYFPVEKLLVTVTSDVPGSNQLCFQPLFINDEPESLQNYEIQFILKAPPEFIEYRPINIKSDKKTDTGLLENKRLRIASQSGRQDENCTPVHVILQNLRSRAEYEDGPFVKNYEGVSPGKSLEIPTFTESVKIDKVRGAPYTGIYFELHAAGHFMVETVTGEIPLLENDDNAWFETQEFLVLLNHQSHKCLTLKAQNTRIFVYKNRNTLYFRVVAKNFIDSGQFIQLEFNH